MSRANDAYHEDAGEIDGMFDHQRDAYCAGYERALEPIKALCDLAVEGGATSISIDLILAEVQP